MIQLLLKPTLSSLWISGTFLLLTACNPATDNSSRENFATTRTAGGGGGTDGSGGNTTTSTPDQVSAALSKIPENLDLAAHNFEMIIKYIRPVAFDAVYGKDSFQLIQKFFQPKTQSTNILQALQNKSISFSYPLQACLSSDGESDGAATGDLQRGSVCLSRDRLLKISPENLETQITILALHELSHLSGFDEEQAAALQSLFANYPQLYKNIRPITNLAGYIAPGSVIEKITYITTDSESCEFYQDSDTTWAMADYMLKCKSYFEIEMKDENISPGAQNPVVIPLTYFTWGNGLKEFCENHQIQHCIQKYQDLLDDAEDSGNSQYFMTMDDKAIVQLIAESNFRLLNSEREKIQKDGSRIVSKILEAAQLHLPGCSKSRTLSLEPWFQLGAYASEGYTGMRLLEDQTCPNIKPNQEVIVLF